MQLAPRDVDLLAIWRNAGRLTREVADERILHGKHGVGIQILIAIHKKMRDKRFMTIGKDHEVHMRGAVRMPRRWDSTMPWFTSGVKPKSSALTISCFRDISVTTARSRLKGGCSQDWLPHSK